MDGVICKQNLLHATQEYHAHRTGSIHLYTFLRMKRNSKSSSNVLRMRTHLSCISDHRYRYNINSHTRAYIYICVSDSATCCHLPDARNASVEVKMDARYKQHLPDNATVHILIVDSFIYWTRCILRGVFYRNNPPRRCCFCCGDFICVNIIYEDDTTSGFSIASGGCA